MRAVGLPEAEPSKRNTQMGAQRNAKAGHPQMIPTTQIESPAKSAMTLSSTHLENLVQGTSTSLQKMSAVQNTVGRTTAAATRKPRQFLGSRLAANISP